jgi:hypothetical protein
MRELTKSISSFSWAMSLFGLQQTANLLSPDNASDAFDSVTKATEEQFGEVVKTTFNAGDKLQRQAVDLTLGFFTGEELNPNRLLRMASDAVRQSAEVVTSGVDATTSTLRQAASTASPQGPVVSTEPAASSGGAASPSQRQGWGPMPS